MLWFKIGAIVREKDYYKKITKREFYIPNDFHDSLAIMYGKDLKKYLLDIKKKIKVKTFTISF